jgi:prepilin-type N-terminal cleavage/methylation domain-containing protein
LTVPHQRQGGFTLIEMTIVLVLMLVGLMIAADLLMETSRLFAETSGEAIETPVPLVIARIRADVQGSTAVTPELNLDGTRLDKVHIRTLGEEILYQKLGDSLYRTVVPDYGPPNDPEVLWHGVTDWTCTTGGKSSPVSFSVSYLRRTTPHTPLPVLPFYRGPLSEPRMEKFYLLPRGNGW